MLNAFTVFYAFTQCMRFHARAFKSQTLPFLSSFLPRKVAIIGYARTQMSDEQLRTKLRPRLKGSEKEVDKFLEGCTYVSGVWLPASALYPQVRCGLDCCQAAAQRTLPMPPT